MFRSILAASLLLTWGTATAEPKPEKPAETPATKPDTASKLLFNGKDLTGWKATKFGGEGEVSVKNGVMILEFGSDLTGVTYTEKPLRTNYELTLEAKRVDGNDFFCGLTFPVGKDHCTLILGGWGGGVVGLSSIDSFDASENDTTQFIEFKKKTWYAVRVRVTPKAIVCWLDGKKIIEQDIEGRKVGTRFEMDLCKPLGIASWQTTAALKNIKQRKLTDKEQAEKIGGEDSPNRVPSPIEK